ncbi:MAG TPA: hypothetical protein VGX96_14205 [Candidatus Elarobacter sp.]|nr:hypothetical protein [Candidatus Elarobacter sp.]
MSSVARHGACARLTFGYNFLRDYVNAHGGLRVSGKSYKVEIADGNDESKSDTSAQLAARLVIRIM